MRGRLIRSLQRHALRFVSTTARSRTFVVNKPYGMLSNFTAPKAGHVKISTAEEAITLQALGVAMPTDVYAAGRLDKDSEGLLVLSNDKNVINTLLSGGLKKTYYVQVLIIYNGAF